MPQEQSLYFDLVLYFRLQCLFAARSDSLFYHKKIDLTLSQTSYSPDPLIFNTPYLMNKLKMCCYPQSLSAGHLEMEQYFIH